MFNSELSCDQSFDNLSHHTPSPDLLVGENLTDINMDEIERNSPILIPERPPGLSTVGTDQLTGRSGQLRRDRLKTLLILRAPKPVKAALSTNHQGLSHYSL